MYVVNYTVQDLFSQLGLDNSPQAIRKFVSTHTLHRDEDLQAARFWNESQAEFIRDAWIEDADWVHAIDELDTLLHVD